MQKRHHAAQGGGDYQSLMIACATRRQRMLLKQILDFFDLYKVLYLENHTADTLIVHLIDRAVNLAQT